jgi:hypothetical protein
VAVMLRWMKAAPVLLQLLAVGCGEAVPAPATPAPSAVASHAAAASATAAQPELFPLRTGILEPVRHAEPLRGTVVGRLEKEEHEILLVRLGWTPAFGRMRIGPTWSIHLESEADAKSVSPLAFMEDVNSDPRSSSLPRVHSELWVLRPKSQAGQPVRGDAYRSHHDREPGQHFRFEASGTAAAPSDRALGRKWGEAFARHLRSRGSLGGGQSAWHAFAADRVLGVHVPGQKPGQRLRGAGSVDRISSELVGLMETTTGASSIQAALQHDRPLFLEAAKQRQTVPIDKVRVVRLAQHPFPAMLRQLGRPVPSEPLAEATPAEFYYLRFATLEALFAVVDQMDVWGTPAASVFSRRSQDYDLANRYLTALGVDRSEIARVLGPQVIARVAVVGSDPYLREGSDVTLIFQVRSRPLFDRGLADALARYERRHGTLTRKSHGDAGATITESRSADGAVRQLRADRGDLTIVSNSPAAIRRVLKAVAGKRPRLADEPDFRFMLARDAEATGQVLGYAGDRFVAEVVGPRQKILEARRQIALAELRTPGYAALLYGWIHGRRPASREQLLSSRLLLRAELRHHDGASIDWEPGRAARSVWGTSRALTPLIDLPPPVRVSRAEQLAYERFARGYERRWATYVDPFMVRLAIDPKAGSPQHMVAQLRVLPLLETFDLRMLIRMVGEARLRVPELGQGLRAVVGIGKDARVRRELSDLRQTLPGGRELKLDWLGDWAMLGIEDHPVVTRVTATLERDLPQIPPSPEERRQQRDADELAVASALPVYAVIGIRSKLGAGLALAWARSKFADADPDLEWKKFGKHGSTSMVRIRHREECHGGRVDDCDLEVFYALTGSALVVAVQEGTLRRVLDELAARSPLAEDGGPHGQLVAELAPRAGGGLWTVASWYLETEALRSERSARATAEVLLRGAPGLGNRPEELRKLGLASFGAMPLTPDGALYRLTREGIFDPARGTPFAPNWPALPVAGSPVEALLDSVQGMRWETEFDDEGPAPGRGQRMRSLNVRATLALSGRR